MRSLGGRYAPLEGPRPSAGPAWAYAPWPVCVALLIATFCLQALVPQVVEAQRRRGPYYRMYGWHGKTAVEVRNDREVRESDQNPKTDLNEWAVSEEISTGAQGWIYHPALLRVSVDLGLKFEQDFVESSGEKGLSQIDALQESFNVNLQVLPDKPYPVSFFTSQIHSDINSPFAPRRSVDTFQYGAGLRLRDLGIGELSTPARAQYRHIETTTNGPFGTDRVADEIEVVVDNETERARNQLEYEWDLQESGRSGNTRTFERQYLRMSQELELANSRLSSQLLATDTGGDFNSQSLSLYETLIVTHGETLNSNYGYSFNFQESASSRQTSNRGFAGLTHQLYQSLSSTVLASVAYTDFDTGSTQQADGSVSLRYTKQIPGGRFGLRFSPSYAYQDEDVESSLASILSELADVLIGVPIEIDNLNAVVTSIVVIDAATQNLFTEGIDYDVIVENTRTFLLIKPAGNIDPTTTPQLSIAYDFVREPARTFTTRTMLYGASLYLFEHWSADVSYSETVQDLIRGSEEDNTLSDESRFNASLSALFAHNSTRLEYERTESDITPRERYSAVHSVNFRPLRRAALNASVGYVRDLITDTGRLSEVYSADANATVWFRYGILGRFGLLARLLDEVEHETTVQGANVSFVYHYGRLRLQLQDQFSWNKVSNKIGDLERTKELVNVLFFRIERSY